MKLTDKQIEKWRVTRQRGRRRFIVVQGMLCWGLLTATLWSIAMEIFESGSSNIFSLNFLIRWLIASILFPVGGLFWGWLLWTQMERQYLEQTSSGRPNRGEQRAGQR